MTARVIGDRDEGHRATTSRWCSTDSWTARRTTDAAGSSSRSTATRVEPWDPFARDEQHTRALPPQVLDYEDSDGRTIAIEVRPFVLPGQHLFSSPEAHRRAGGPRRWNRHQGFYIYRRDRLIQAGGWNRLRTLDEHAKLARIAIDLPLGR